MSAIRLTGSTSGYAEITPSAIAGDVQLVLPSTAGTLDRLNRAGNVLQVVNATYSTSTTRASSAYADTNLTASITPASATNKILVIVHHNGCGKNTSDTQLQLRLLRDSTVIAQIEDTAGYDGSSGSNYIGTCSISYLDSPSSTSAITYKTQYASAANTSQVQLQANSTVSTITLMEVAA
jgi:hypothetical protein